MKYSDLFPCRDCCRCFRLNILFIPNVSRHPVIVAGGLWHSRPHSYLTPGPFHHLAHSQKHIVSEWLLQPLRYSNSGAVQHSLSPARTKAPGNCGPQRSSRCLAATDWVVGGVAARLLSVICRQFSSCSAVEFGQEVAAEHLLHGGMSC